nr:MAG TPA: hypothetical protein [Caudoviricetes sp.]
MQSTNTCSCRRLTDLSLPLVIWHSESGLPN